MKLDAAKEAVVQAEQELAEALEKLGERHKADHDVFHMTRTLAKMSRARIERLGHESDAAASNGLLAKAREKASEMVGSRPEAGMLLLRDLRELHLAAAEASINWVILGQGAQAAKDAELLELVSECHAEELRALKWTVTHIKVTAPQVLTS